jgi:hypothetical protein
MAELLWHDTSTPVRNHRLRSLLHRVRQAGAALECTETAVRFTSRPVIDFREYSTRARSVQEVSRLVAEIGPVLPGLAGTPGTPLAARLDDERDVIRATVIRWVNAAGELARGAGDWALVEQLARAGRVVDRFNEDACWSVVESRESHWNGRGPSAAPPRRIHFACPEHAGRPLDFVLALTARLLDEPGAAGCDPSSYALLTNVTRSAPNDVSDGGGPSLPDAFLGAFLDLLSALGDEAPAMVIVEDAPIVEITASPFWRAVLDAGNRHRIGWRFAHAVDASATTA